MAIPDGSCANSFQVLAIFYWMACVPLPSLRLRGNSLRLSDTRAQGLLKFVKRPVFLDDIVTVESFWKKDV